MRKNPRSKRAGGGRISRKRGRQAPAMSPKGTLRFSRLEEQSCSVGHPGCGGPASFEKACQPGRRAPSADNGLSVRDGGSRVPALGSLELGGGRG